MNSLRTNRATANGVGLVEKKLPETVAGKRTLIEPEHPELSLRRQCELVGLNRPVGTHQPARESPLNLAAPAGRAVHPNPFYGWSRMTTYLHVCGYPVNHKRVQRLLRKNGVNRYLSQAPHDL